MVINFTMIACSYLLQTFRAKRSAEEEKRRAEAEKWRAEEEKQRVEEEKQRVEKEKLTIDIDSSYVSILTHLCWCL